MASAAVFRDDLEARKTLSAGSKAAPPDAVVFPTRERMRQGPVELLPRPIADDAGRPAQPFRSIDILAALERRGAISAEMRQAGEDFRSRFRRAQLDPLRAADMARTPGQARAGGDGVFIEGARDQVWRAIQALGGLDSPGGSCLWHVVGLEFSLKEWALNRGWSGRFVSQEAASGILIAALGALERHWRAPSC